MSDQSSKLFIEISYDLDRILGAGNVIDASFSGYQPTDPTTDTHLVFEKIKALRILNHNNEDVFPFFKKSYIEQQLNALELQLKLFQDPQSYDGRYAEVARIFIGIELPEPSLTEITEIHNKLNSLLQTDDLATLAERLQAWKNHYQCSSSAYLKEAKMVTKEYAALTFTNIFPHLIDDKDIAGLKELDSITLEAEGTTASWTAYNYYSGNYTGKVIFNEAVPFYKNTIRTFVAHEIFPGHHASDIIKEYYLKNITRDDYMGIKFLNTPSCLIEEGMADAGLELLGISPSDTNELIEYYVGELHAAVTYYSTYQLFINNKDEADVSGEIKSMKLLINDSDVSRNINFIKSWKYYVPSYKLGRDFVRRQMEKYTDQTELLKLLYLCPIPSVINDYAK